MVFSGVVNLLSVSFELHTIKMSSKSFVKQGCSSNYNNMVINAYLVVRLVIFRSAYQVLYGPKLQLDISSPLLNAAAAANFQISTKKLIKVNLHVFVC